MSLPRKIHIAILVLSFGPPACTSQTTDNFENPPPGPPASCATSADVTGCTGGSQGYVCTKGRPDDGDTNLVCSDGTPGGAGTTVFCCAPYGQYWSDCTVDTSVPGCVGDAFGFTCSGPERPDDADSSILCNAGAASGSDTVFCCNSAVLSPTCAPDATITTCGALAVGYSCAGSDSPGNSAPSLACSIGQLGGDGTTPRCCIPFPQAADACQEDDAVPGCAAGSYGFTCAGTTTPEAQNPALQCQGLPVAGLFCCDLAPE